jgi:3-oxoacyl-(acyl-carrier-protein) synthase
MSMQLAITGTGAVSSAGWGVAAMMDALKCSARIPVSALERPLGDAVVSTPVRRVPEASAGVPKSARMRRASAITRFAAAAAMEALGAERAADSLAGRLRVGVVFTLTNGCVNYSNRFFGEVLADPALPSPILFPETVFNAPSSHISALIGSNSPNDTIVGDETAYLSGIDLAAEWISRGDVDGCLVVAAEETDWLSAEGLCLYSKHHVPSEGAGAIYLEASAGPVRLHYLPDPVPYPFHGRINAVRIMRETLSSENDGHTLLVDSRAGVRRFDQAENLAWRDWSGPRWSPKRVLGESMGAACALQVVAAAEALKSGDFKQVIVSSAGSNQQAAGMVLRSSACSPQQSPGFLLGGSTMTA